MGVTPGTGGWLLWQRPRDPCPLAGCSHLCPSLYRDLAQILAAAPPSPARPSPNPTPTADPVSASDKGHKGSGGNGGGEQGSRALLSQPLCCGHRRQDQPCALPCKPPSPRPTRQTGPWGCRCTGTGCELDPGSPGQADVMAGLVEGNVALPGTMPPVGLGCQKDTGEALGRAEGFCPAPLCRGRGSHPSCFKAAVSNQGAEGFSQDRVAGSTQGCPQASGCCGDKPQRPSLQRPLCPRARRPGPMGCSATLRWGIPAALLSGAPLPGGGMGCQRVVGVHRAGQGVPRGSWFWRPC